MKNVRLFHFLLLILLLPFSFVSWSYTLKQPGILSVCSYSRFKPITYGNGDGYEADLLKAVAASWDVKIQFYPEYIYDGLWRSPSRNYTLCDVAIGGFTPDDYRIKEGTSFSVKTALFDQSLLVRKADFDSRKITSYASFKHSHLKIGVVPGTTGEKYARLRAKENHLSDDVIVQYQSESELLPALMKHDIAAIARGEIGNKYQEMHNPDVITIAKKNFGEGFTISVDSANPALLAALNQSINKITKNGRITYQDWLKNKNVFMES